MFLDWLHPGCIHYFTTITDLFSYFWYNYVRSIINGLNTNIKVSLKLYIEWLLKFYEPN